MQLRCFGLKARKHEKDVVECEAMFEEWAQALPLHFKMQGTDHSLDTLPGYGWLKHQRKNLHSKYYIARISLHRPYLLATVEDPDEVQDGAKYESSKDACMLSAMADLNLRTQTEEADPLDRFKWVTVSLSLSSCQYLMAGGERVQSSLDNGYRLLLQRSTS
jgi:hypothetical protein